MDIDTMKSTRRFRAARIVSATLSMILLVAAGACRPMETGGSQAVSSAQDYEIPTVDGETIRLSQFRGKVVVIDFWATYCVPCRVETPHLVQIARDFGDKGVVVIGISVDNPGAPITKFMQDFGVNYTIGFAPNGMFAQYDTSGDGLIPQTLIFGRDGHKLLQTAGFDPIQNGEELRRAVEAALKS